jgi:hypothetical protein
MGIIQSIAVDVAGQAEVFFYALAENCIAAAPKFSAMVEKSIATTNTFLFHD